MSQNSLDTSGRPGRRTLLGVRLSSPHLRGTVWNVSDTGALVETNDALVLDRIVEVALHHGSGTLETLAEVRWCRLVRTETRSNDETLPVYRVGLRFVEILTARPQGVWAGVGVFEEEAGRRRRGRASAWLKKVGQTFIGRK